MTETVTANIAAQTPQWLKDTYAHVDALDVEGFVSRLSEDVTFRFGNAPQTTGREAVREGLAQFFSTIKGMRHHFLQVWEAGDSYSLVLDVDYTRKDEAVVTVPVVTVCRRNGDLVDHMQIVIDLAPVFAPPAAA
jgi:ketosteroid isomerase-like protein